MVRCDMIVTSVAAAPASVASVAAAPASVAPVRGKGGGNRGNAWAGNRENYDMI